MQAIELFARGKTGKEISKEIGISEVSISKWKRNPEYMARLQQTAESYTALKVMSVEDKLSALENEAINTLKELLSSNKSDNVRLKAAQLILQHKNTRKPEGEGSMLINFNLPEPAMPDAENIEDGDTTGT